MEKAVGCQTKNSTAVGQLDPVIFRLENGDVDHLSTTGRVRGILRYADC